MTGWRAQRRLTRLISGMRIPGSADSAALCHAAAEHLGTPIHLLPATLPAGAPCGIVISTAHSHYVAYDNRTSPLHQRHIVAHELGHLLAGHCARPLAGSDLARLLMPTLDPALVTSVLGRSPGYDEQAEWEAEFIAGLLRRHRARQPAPSADPSTAEVVDRIRHTLGGV